MVWNNRPHKGQVGASARYANWQTCQRSCTSNSARRLRCRWQRQVRRLAVILNQRGSLQTYIWKLWRHTHTHSLFSKNSWSSYVFLIGLIALSVPYLGCRLQHTTIYFTKWTGSTEKYAVLKTLDQAPQTDAFHSVTPAYLAKHDMRSNVEKDPPSESTVAS